MKAAPYHSLQEVADDTTTSHRRQLAIGISRAVCLYAMPVCLHACACMSVCMCAVCVGTGQNLGSLIQSSVSGCASSSGCGLEFHWCIFFGTWWRKFTQFPVSLPGPWSEGQRFLCSVARQVTNKKALRSGPSENTLLPRMDPEEE